MEKSTGAFFILHLSDFHISDQSSKEAKSALNAITEKLKDEKINIKYLIHTGDVINSNDIEAKIIKKYGKALDNKEYDEGLEKIVKRRFNIAKNIVKNFARELDILPKNIIVCCGNHDKLRYKKKESNPFGLFDQFLYEVCKDRDDRRYFQLDDLNVLVLNTNISDEKDITCIDCEELKKKMSNENYKTGETDWFYTYGKKSDATLEKYRLNVIVAHQPLYDICEDIRLPYGSETQETDFLSALQDFIDGNGVYLCGDKHTSSITASFIHDIPHYFCGHPFVYTKNKKQEKKHTNSLPSTCKKMQQLDNRDIKIDYNLIEVQNGKIGQVRKLHLIQNAEKVWICEIHPIDSVVSRVYEISRRYIVQNSFALLARISNTKYGSWEKLSWRNLFSRLDAGSGSGYFQEISKFYHLFCRLKDDDGKTIQWANDEDIFQKLNGIISDKMSNNRVPHSDNMINIRGDYSSGKSTFLGLLYIYLLFQYTYGKLDYIPAYFNLENDDILNRIQEESNYSSAVKKTFSSFVCDIEYIAKKEHISVCYIIDGLDEQDIWTESSQDSIGRVVLDILAETNNSKYIMSFCQNRLARFKNTMPAIKYYEHSHVMYFNSIAVKENRVKDSKFVKFIEQLLSFNQKEKSQINDKDNFSTELEPKECSAIRKLRRLSINPGFIYYNYQYLRECKENDSVDTVYRQYIDQQHQICLDTLEYNFVHYAPAMAYLFTYEGYTYEKFKTISLNTTDYWEQNILKYSNKIYEAFIFIKKNKDAREYLLALHYNRELRYYAENPEKAIAENSIINKLIPRNISIIIKKLWRNDQNKFIIVCHNLIKKRQFSNNKIVNNCTLSMLTYILAYLNEIPDYVRDEIKGLLFHFNVAGKRSDDGISEIEKVSWEISGDNSEKMKKFIDLNFQHSQWILNSINLGTSIRIVIELIKQPAFALYNRQYMMWYYGDLTIYGENRIKNLVPGDEKINKWVDYYNCFYTLYHKIYAYFECECNYAYPLLEFDLFTICDLVYSRHFYTIQREILCSSDTKYEIYKCIKYLLDKYIAYYNEKERSDRNTEHKNELDVDISEIDFQSNNDKISYKKISEYIESRKIIKDEEYVYMFFCVIRELVFSQNE